MGEDIGRIKAVAQELDASNVLMADANTGCKHGWGQQLQLPCMVRMADSAAPCWSVFGGPCLYGMDGWQG